jgi:protein-tyrosine-phosphatase
MAEGILRYRWEQSGREGLTVSSMGIHGLDSQAASKFGQEICEENGIDISSHRSKKLVIPELEAADLILSMEWVQKDFLRIFFPKFSDKSFLLGVWPDMEKQKKSKKDNIKDPYGGSKKAYRETFEVISGHITRVMTAIEQFYF